MGPVRKEIMTRKTSELLEMVYHEISYNKIRSICFATDKLEHNSEITVDEKIRVDAYIRDHKPLSFYIRRDSYFWRPKRIKPRLKYLKKHINKLKKQ